MFQSTNQKVSAVRWKPKNTEQKQQMTIQLHSTSIEPIIMIHHDELQRGSNHESVSTLNQFFIVPSSDLPSATTINQHLGWIHWSISPGLHPYFGRIDSHVTYVSYMVYYVFFLQ